MEVSARVAPAPERGIRRTLAAALLAAACALGSPAAAQDIGFAVAGYGGYAGHADEAFEAGTVLGGEVGFRGGPFGFFTRYEQETLPLASGDAEGTLSTWNMGARFFFIQDRDIGMGGYLHGNMVLLSSVDTAEDYGPMAWGVGSGVEIGSGSLRGLAELEYRIYGDPLEDSDFTIDPSGLGVRVGLMLFAPMGSSRW